MRGLRVLPGKGWRPTTARRYKRADITEIEFTTDTMLSSMEGSSG